ncbi:MAG: MarR family transcriptional regulator [Planctomycetales bacterium]
MPHSKPSSTSMRIMRLLIGKPPQSLTDLMEVMGVTRTAVTEQLSVLMKDGYVDRTQQRSGRGRPRHLYMATEKALSLFPSNEQLVVPALLSAMRDIAGNEVVDQVLRRVSDEMADHYQVGGNNPKERLAQLVELLKSNGTMVELQDDQGRMMMQERSCPFWTMASDDRSACNIEEMMMSKVVDAPVRLVQCRLDGCDSCTFELLELDSGGETTASSSTSL